MNDPIDIAIHSVEFDVSGLLEASAWIEGKLVEFSIDPSERLYHEILPPGFTVAQCQNHEGLFIARMNRWHNIHFLVCSEAGQIFERAVKLEGWLEGKLLETYHKNY